MKDEKEKRRLQNVVFAGHQGVGYW